jgi:hypothetical protein
MGLLGKGMLATTGAIETLICPRAGKRPVAVRAENLRHVAKYDWNARA